MTDLDFLAEDVEDGDTDGLSPAQLQARVRHLEVSRFVCIHEKT